MCSRLEHRLPPPVSGDTECRKPSGDEGGMGWSSAEKGISSADLCSVSPTCRARGNNFSILQRPGFLSNSLSFFSCVFISLPLLLVSHFVLCCAVRFSLFTCSLLTGIKFHWKSWGTHLRHTMNTRYYSAAAHKLSLPCKSDHKPQLWGEGRQDAEGP